MSYNYNRLKSSTIFGELKITDASGNNASTLNSSSITFNTNPSFPTNTNIGTYGATTLFVDNLYQSKSAMSSYAILSTNTFSGTQTFNNELVISPKNINFYNQFIAGTYVPLTQSINWFSVDSALIGKIETNDAASSMNFSIDPNEIQQGFKFTGGNINSTSQQQTWYISTTTSGNSYTPATRVLGSANNSASPRFNKVTTYGGATAGDWNTSTAVFTASQAGTYHIQLFLFNNSTSTSGRWLQAAGTCILGGTGTQYITFNQSYLTTDAGASTVSLMYYINANQTFYFYCPFQSPSFYYGDGHTVLQIIKML